MNDEVYALISKDLAAILSHSEVKTILDKNDFITIGEKHAIFHPDVIRRDIYQSLLSQGLTEREAIVTSDQYVTSLASRIKQLGFILLDKWAVTLEHVSCEKCPAFQWVIHRNGANKCRLQVDIDEQINDRGEWVAAPVEECMKPRTVGACYMIARELNLPEPIVGKLDCSQYEQYCKERDL